MEIAEPIENYQAGWIKIFRSIQDHWIWQDANKLKWWLDIMLETNHTDKKVVLGNDIIECKRGQTIRSLSGWATRWNVSKDTARNFINLLEKDKMISRVNLKKTTQLTICNYDTYQSYLHVKQTTAERGLYTNKELKELNKDNNTVVFEQFRILYGGTKRGLETEFKNFQKKHQDWKQVLPLLVDRIKKQIANRDALTAKGEFVPRWKNLQTWINNRCWEDELEEIIEIDKSKLIGINKDDLMTK